MLAEVNRFYKRVGPSTGMCAINLLHDNALAHNYKLVQEYLFNETTEMLPHSPYSPDLASCDFFLFPDLKNCLAGRRFNSRSSLGTAVFQCLSRIAKIEFKRTFLLRSRRLSERVVGDGEHFEKMKWKKRLAERTHFTSRISHKMKHLCISKNRLKIKCAF